VQLFDNRLTPYASRSTVHAEVRSGFYPGAIPDSTTTTAGLLLRLGDLRARASSARSTGRPVRTPRGWGSCSTSARSPARPGSTPRPRTAGGTIPTDAPACPAILRTQTTDLASVDVQQKLFARTMLLSVGGSYSEMHGLLDTRSHSLHASLSWKIGRTDFSAGATIYDSESEGGGIAISRRTRRLYSLRLRRDLF